MASSHKAPEGHDHDTCTVHSCPAIASEPNGVGLPHDILLTTLVWLEAPLTGPAQTDDLKRPPRS